MEKAKKALYQPGSSGFIFNKCLSGKSLNCWWLLPSKAKYGGGFSVRWPTANWFRMFHFTELLAFILHLLLPWGQEGADEPLPSCLWGHQWEVGSTGSRVKLFSPILREDKGCFLFFFFFGWWYSQHPQNMVRLSKTQMTNSLNLEHYRAPFIKL